jgi:hypothetical protein
MNPLLTGEIGGGQPAAVKRREQLSARGGIGARCAMTRRNSFLLHGRVFITARWKLIGGPRFTAYRRNPMNKLNIIVLAIAAAYFASPSLQAKYLDDETDLIYYGHRV